MKKKLIIITILFTALIGSVTFLFYRSISSKGSEAHTREQLVALNEIEQLALQTTKNPDETSTTRLHTAVKALHENIANNSYGGYIKQQQGVTLILGGICIVFLLVVLGYVYRAILHPFDKMKDYAEEIASGNLELPLNYERSNYFGAYTWAFDHMRHEIVKARACEKEAILNNKTVIATLSHDIKTPIASIRAYAEGLDANMDTDMEKRRHYTSVIMSKCDEVTKLTNDLFLHSLSDLHKLKMEYTNVQMQPFLETFCKENGTGEGQVIPVGLIPSAELCIDQKRIEQALENLTNNAKKYARSRIELSATVQDKHYEIHIRDYGPGIPNEDMPFITEKFYRGHNVENQDGSGLGLYIVSYIMQQHSGTLNLINDADGLEAVLSLPLE